MRFLAFVIFIIGFGSTTTYAQELSIEYQFATKEHEHYVMNYPEDSTQLQWGIWLNTSDPDFSFHTMKLFLNKDQSLYLEHFHGIGEIILSDNERIPITVFWFENVQPQFENFDKVLAIQFNQEESNLLMKHELKKIIFYTSYGKFVAKFARKDMIQNALFTLKYNMEIFKQVNSAILAGKLEE